MCFMGQRELILAKVVDVIAKQLNKKPEQIEERHRVIEDLGADSLDMIEMLMTLEEGEGVTIPDDEAVNLKTVGQIVDYLSSI